MQGPIALASKWLTTESRPRSRRLVFVQYGDYREAVRRFDEGDAETYVAQRYSVNHVSDIAKRMDVTVVCLPAEPHDERLSNGVRAIGLGHDPGRQDPRLIATLERLRPTDVVMTTPHLPALAWCLLRGVRVLPVFADSFQARSLFGRARVRLLAALLSHPSVPLVANHNRPASFDLVRIGVPPHKVLPWDWPAQHTPAEYPPRSAPPADRPLRLFYVGTVATAKGVGDAIVAQRRLADLGVDTTLAIAGSGDEVGALQALVQRARVSDRVTFLGRIQNAAVVPTMREHDVVLVPSHHAYPEGLPMTIYEALCAQTPLVVSDHPMFRRVLRHEESALIFPASDPDSLAEAARRLRTDRELYERLSRRSQATWARIQIPLQWGDLIDRWLSYTDANRGYLAQMSLDALEDETSGAL